jgi:anti-sigma factor (TIGR02949 family)
MKCRECIEHLYEYLDRELTPAVETEIRAHLTHCPPCGHKFDFEAAFQKFVKAKTRAHGCPPELKQRILRELFDE